MHPAEPESCPVDGGPLLLFDLGLVGPRIGAFDVGAVIPMQDQARPGRAAEASSICRIQSAGVDFQPP